MKPFLDLFFPLQLDTLRGWWVLLSLAVIGGGLLYSFVQYFFVSQDQPQFDPEEEVSTEELLANLDVADTINNDLQQQTLSVEKQPRWVSVLSFFKSQQKAQVEDVFNGEGFDEEVERQVEEDGFHIDEEVMNETQDISSVEETQPEENLMTEQKAKEIDNLTRSNIQREEFESELNYLKKKQKREEVEKKLIEGLAKDPDHDMVIDQLAHHYIDHDQAKKALPLLKKLLDKNPDHHKVLREMSDIYLSLGDVETSEVLVKRALGLNPKNPKYAITLVEIYYNTRRKDDAITLMEDIVKRRPANLGYRDTLAKLYEEVKDYELAVECYQSMLLIDPKNTTIKRKLLETRTKIS